MAFTFSAGAPGGKGAGVWLVLLVALGVLTIPRACWRRS